MAMIILHAGDAAHAKASGHVLTADTALIVMDDGNGFILDLAKHVHALTPVATDMIRWRLEGGRDAALDRLAEVYAADRATLGRDLDCIWDALTSEGVIVPSEQSAPPRGADIASFLARLQTTLLKLPLPLRAQAWLGLALCRVSFGLAGFAATTAEWQRKIARGQESPSGQADAIGATVREVCARHWLRVDCKERALTIWALARRAGADPTVVVGLRPYPLSGHAWCQIGETILGDKPVFCDTHQPVFRYAAV